MSEPTMEYMREQLAKISDAQPMKVYCQLCPNRPVVGEGTAEQARLAAEQHRTAEHPDVADSKRVTRRRRGVFSQAMTAEREAQIEEERRQRMRALGQL